jgi:hypothetical protein
MLQTISVQKRRRHLIATGVWASWLPDPEYLNVSRLHNFLFPSSKTANLSYLFQNIIFRRKNEFCGRLCVGSMSSWDYFLSLERHQQLQKVKKGKRNFISCDTVSFRILQLAGSLGSRSGTGFGQYPIRFLTSYQAEDRNKESWCVMAMFIRDLTTVVIVHWITDGLKDFFVFGDSFTGPGSVSVAVFAGWRGRLRSGIQILVRRTNVTISLMSEAQQPVFPALSPVITHSSLSSFSAVWSEVRMASF